MARSDNGSTLVLAVMGTVALVVVALAVVASAIAWAWSQSAASSASVDKATTWSDTVRGIATGILGAVL